MSQAFAYYRQDVINTLVKYRNATINRIATFWLWVCESLSLMAVYTSRDIWDKLHFWLCYLKSTLILDNEEKQKLLQWVKLKISSNRRPSEANRKFSECFRENVTHFINCWRDGILLCALVESIVPDSCPRYDLLNPEHKCENVRLALKLVEKKIGIKPVVTAEEIINCAPEAERKIACLLAQIKIATTKMKEKSSSNSSGEYYEDDDEGDDDVEFGVEQECVARGMGLVLAVSGRQARFNIFLKSLANLNIVIEIKGPSDTLCSERITNRSPKRKNSLETQSIEKKSGMKAYRTIPFEYEVLPGRISIGYKPICSGQHKLSIIWQGQHIMGSPYVINVDSTAFTEEDFKLKQSDSRLKIEKYRNTQDDVERVRSSKFGAVINKRVLRHIMVVDGKEVVVEANSKDFGRLTQSSSSVDEDEDEDDTFAEEIGEIGVDGNSKVSSLPSNYKAAHFPASPNVKTISNPPILRTVLEGLNQPNLDLKIHSFKPKRLHAVKIPPNLILDKDENNLKELYRTGGGTSEEINTELKEMVDCIKNNKYTIEIGCETKKDKENEKLERNLDNQKGTEKTTSEEDMEKQVTVESVEKQKENSLDTNSEKDCEQDDKIICVEKVRSTLTEKQNSSNYNTELLITENIPREEPSVKNKEKDIGNRNTNNQEISKEENDRLNSKLKYFYEEINPSYLNDANSESNSNQYYLTPVHLTVESCSGCTDENSSDLKIEKNLRYFNKNQEVTEPLLSKHLKPAKSEGNLVRNKVKEWEQAMSRVASERFQESETIKPEVQRSESPVLVPVYLRKQFWENGGHNLSIQDPINPVSQEYMDELATDLSSSSNTIPQPTVEIKPKLNKSTQVSQDDICKKPPTLKKFSSWEFTAGTPDSEDSGIFNSRRSLFPGTTAQTMKSASASPSPTLGRRGHSNSRLFRGSVSSETIDALSVNTELERGFIDDEIPDYANILMDNYISFTGLLDTERPISRRELLKHDFVPDKQEKYSKEPPVPKPERCRVFGTGVYYGQVNLRNHFQVRTRGAGPGYLSVNVQGADVHDVIETTILYSGNDMYDVLYEVSQPGYYVITIKWGEFHIPENPFICKVTY